MTNKLKNNKKWCLLPIVGALLLSIPILFWPDLHDHMDRMREKQDKDYPSIKKLNVEIKGIIINIKTASFYSGTNLYTLSNDSKFSLSGQVLNNQYNQFDKNLMRMLSIGDSIFKPMNTDSIYVFRKERKYYYTLK